MSETTASLRRQIRSADDLRSVVRTMKALAASSIGQYERSVRALADYQRTVRLGLGACVRALGPLAFTVPRRRQGEPRTVRALVLGSDQGLVGQFNEAIAAYALAHLADAPGTVRVWAVGERVHARLVEAGLSPAGAFAVPGSVHAIIALVRRVLIESGIGAAPGEAEEFFLFHNRPSTGTAHAPAGQRLLPLDQRWLEAQRALAWPERNLPEVLGDPASTLQAFIGEYLFVSLFRACAESLASENASRLAAMQRAEKNIDELLERLNGSFHQLRQDGIDAELFDLVAGFEALSGEA